jgi:NAD(P)-dependent dehydrogenase (short-subunit alcohol dehydrogenase family)
MDSIKKVALITGAGSGIGRECALALGRDGFQLVLAGRRRDSLMATQDALEAIGATAHVVPTDVTDPSSVRALFLEIRRVCGRLDVVFNNAGLSAPPVLLEDLTYEQWRATLDTSITGAFLCTQEAFKLMKEQSPRGGRIINNGSISAQVPRPNSAPYTAAKHAMTGLTKSTSLDGRKYNIACGQIDIGNAATDMTEKMKRGVPQADGSLGVEPTMDVAHVGRAVAYMAGLPLEANVLSMTVMATQMPFTGRG